MQRSTVSILFTTTYMWQVGRGKFEKPERGEDRERKREREREREKERERHTDRQSQTE